MGTTFKFMFNYIKFVAVNFFVDLLKKFIYKFFRICLKNVYACDWSVHIASSAVGVEF